MRHADLALVNGRIATLDAGDRTVSCLAAQGGRIIALGERAEIDHAIGLATRIIDLGGRRAVPGIVDSHCHPDSYAVRLIKWRDIGPDKIASKAELLRRIDQGTVDLTLDRWFAGYRYNERLSGG